MNREQIYYWKCDRPDAFASLGKARSTEQRERIEQTLEGACRHRFGTAPFSLAPFPAQGNHCNYTVTTEGKQFFIRVDDGPENDGYMAVETEVIHRVGALGVPVPQVYQVDTSRQDGPFAYQMMEVLPYPDLNVLYKENRLDTPAVMRQLGRYIATWQSIRTEGAGLFDTELCERTGVLRGLHPDYASYYFLQFDRHLDFLCGRDFIQRSFADDIRQAVGRHRHRLDITDPCLVHKDIALWNLVGGPDHIAAVIDWDDTIMGDPCDDLSLMACYHCWDELQPLFSGYESVRPLPRDFEPRFWLHLLRNILFKSVIRVGAGYFGKDRNFFLIPSDPSPAEGDFKQFTLDRLHAAYEGLCNRKQIESL